MTRYEIGLRGSSGRLVADAFDDLAVVSGSDETVLSGDLPDQAALFGVLTRILDLGLELLWTRVVDPPAGPRPTAATLKVDHHLVD